MKHVALVSRQHPAYAVTDTNWWATFIKNGIVGALLGLPPVWLDIITKGQPLNPQP